MYVKPDPCWKAVPEQAASYYPIKPCMQFKYLNKKSRGNCSAYGVEADVRQCWIQVEYTPPNIVSPIVGWIQYATTSTGAAAPGDVCAPAVKINNVQQVFVGLCSNRQCTKSEMFALGEDRCFP